jgi:hypothetical protein
MMSLESNVRNGNKETYEVALCKRYINYNLVMLLELDAFVISPMRCIREMISGSL